MVEIIEHHSHNGECTLCGMNGERPRPCTDPNCHGLLHYQYQDARWVDENQGYTISRFYVCDRCGHLTSAVQQLTNVAAHPYHTAPLW